MTDRSKRLSQLIQLVLVILFLYATIRFQWLNAVLILGILFTTFLPMIIARRFDHHLPNTLELGFIVFIFFSLYLGEFADFYEQFWWWDVLLHSGSGVLFGIIGFSLVYTLNAEQNVRIYMKPGFVALFSFTLVMCLGGLWEIFEFAMDQFFGLAMQKSGLTDTMADLMMDAAGGLVTSVIGYFYMKRKESKGLTLDKVTKVIREKPELFR